MKDFNYKLTIHPDIKNSRNMSLSMLFTSMEELNAAQFMASNLLLFLQDDISVMNDSENLFIVYEFNEDYGEWEEIPE